jgi:hypothetical protein
MFTHDNRVLITNKNKVIIICKIMATDSQHIIVRNVR